LESAPLVFLCEKPRHSKSGGVFWFVSRFFRLLPGPTSGALCLTRRPPRWTQAFRAYSRGHGKRGYKSERGGIHNRRWKPCLRSVFVGSVSLLVGAATPLGGVTRRWPRGARNSPPKCDLVGRSLDARARARPAHELVRQHARPSSPVDTTSARRGERDARARGRPPGAPSDGPNAAGALPEA